MVETNTTIRCRESVRVMLSVAGSLQNRGKDVKNNSRTSTGGGVTFRPWHTPVTAVTRPSLIVEVAVSEPIVRFPLQYKATPYNQSQYVQHTISDARNTPILRYTSMAYNREIGPQIEEIVAAANIGAEVAAKAKARP